MIILAAVCGLALLAIIIAVFRDYSDRQEIVKKVRSTGRPVNLYQNRTYISTRANQTYSGVTTQYEDDGIPDEAVDVMTNVLEDIMVQQAYQMQNFVDSVNDEAPVATSGYVQAVESADVNSYATPSYEHLATPSYEAPTESYSAPSYTPSYDDTPSSSYDNSPSYGDTNAGCDNSSSYDSFSGDA